MTRSDPAVRKMMARQLWLSREMRREGKSLIAGKPYTPAANTDVSKLWALYDYTPPSLCREDSHA